MNALPVVPLTNEQRALVERHSYLARYMAGVMRCPASMEKADLLSSAYYALCLAASRWRPGGGASFRTYAIQKIRWAIQEKIRTAAGGARSRGQASVSLSSPIMSPGGADTGLTLGDTIPGDDESTVMEDVRLRLTMEAIDSLPARMQDVIRGRLSGDSFDDIGRRLGVTESRAKQIEQQAIRELQRALQYLGAPWLHGDVSG